MAERASRQKLAERLRADAERGWPKDAAPPFPNREAELLAFAAMVETTGECRVGKDTAGLLPVLEADGLRWECTHEDATHRSAVVAPREV